MFRVRAHPLISKCTNLKALGVWKDNYGYITRGFFLSNYGMSLEISFSNKCSPPPTKQKNELIFYLKTSLKGKARKEFNFWPLEILGEGITYFFTL